MHFFQLPSIKISLFKAHIWHKSRVVKKKIIKIMTLNRNAINLFPLDLRLDIMGRSQIRNKINQTDFCENANTVHTIPDKAFHPSGTLI